MELHDKKYPIPDKELVGKIFNRWTVLKKAGQDKHGVSCWMCKCECGTEKIVREYSLLNGMSKSCGCFSKETNAKTALEGNTASINRVYGWYKRHCSDQNRIFELTREEFIRLTSSDCHYCGNTPSNICNLGKNGSYTYNGIDRVDNTKGYTLNNCVPCCETCNRAKLKMTTGEFLNWINRVYSHQQRIIKKGL